jgi:hypothetical protein
MAEHLRANTAYFAGSEARQAVFTTDTIRVAQPKEPKTFVETEQRLKASASSIKRTYVSDDQPQDWLKQHCMGLYESVRIILPSPTSLHKIARPDQRRLADQAISAIDRFVNQLKTDIESIFDESSWTPLSQIFWIIDAFGESEHSALGLD